MGAGVMAKKQKQTRRIAREGIRLSWLMRVLGATIKLAQDRTRRLGYLAAMVCLATRSRDWRTDLWRFRRLQGNGWFIFFAIHPIVAVSILLLK